MEDDSLVTAEIREAFYREVQDLAQEVERYLLLLEEDPANEDYIREVFRPFHTIKGNAALTGEEEILQLSQLAESVLDEVRQGRRPLTHPMLEGALATIDLIRTVSHGGDAAPHREAVAQMLARLKSLLEEPDAEPQTVPTPPPVDAGPCAFGVTEEQCRQWVECMGSLDRAIERMKYERAFMAGHKSAQGALVALSGIPDGDKRCRVAKRYLTYLARAVDVYARTSLAFSPEAWELLGTLRDDVRSALYPLLLRRLRILVAYVNPGESLDGLRASIDAAEEAGGHLINLNVDSVPSRREIEAMIELSRRLGARVAFVQRSLGQQRFWREIPHVHPDAPPVRSTLWQGLEDLTRAG